MRLRLGQLGIVATGLDKERDVVMGEAGRIIQSQAEILANSFANSWDFCTGRTMRFGRGNVTEAQRWAWTRAGVRAGDWRPHLPRWERKGV